MLENLHLFDLKNKLNLPIKLFSNKLKVDAK